LELERRFIERTDFPAARRGYDPVEVDHHLRQVANRVEELKRSAPASDSSSVASAAAEQVRGIVDAAEQSAAEIRSKAQREAEEMRRGADREASEARERAGVEAVAHVERVEEATAKLLERARAIESELDGLIGELSGSIGSLVATVRDGAGSLSTRLEQMRSDLSQVGADPIARGEPAVGGPVAAAPDVVAEVQKSTAEAAPERKAGQWGRIVLPAVGIGVLLGVALLIVLGSGDGSRHDSAPVARARPKLGSGDGSRHDSAPVARARPKLGSEDGSRHYSAPVARVKLRPTAARAAPKHRVRRRHRAPARQSASTQTTPAPAPSPPANALPPIRPARRATTVSPVRTRTAPREQKAPPRPAYPIPPRIVRSLPSRVRQRLMRARIARSARVWSPAARGRRTLWSTRHSSPASSANPTWRRP
jgi:DivIVA domain-containing protein